MKLKDLRKYKKKIVLCVFMYLIVGYFIVVLGYIISSPGILEKCPPDVAKFKCEEGGLKGLIKNLTFSSDFWFQVLTWPLTVITSFLFGD